MSVRSFSFDDVMLFINFSNACAKNDVHYIEIACEKMYRKGFKPEDIQYFVEHDYFRIYENFFVNKKKSIVPDKKYVLDNDTYNILVGAVSKGSIVEGSKFLNDIGIYRQE